MHFNNWSFNEESMRGSKIFTTYVTIKFPSFSFFHDYPEF